MSAEGFCLLTQSDEPLNERARCLPHGEIAIAPSWGDRTQRWCDGTWTPHVEKPANYQYRPKVYVEPSIKTEHHPRVCVQCRMPLPGAVRGPSKQLYCGPHCKNKAAWTRRVEGRVAS